MIITQTPLRISLAGGGTDFQDYYRASAGGGGVVSTAIDKYVYVIVKERFDQKIRVGYSRTEMVDSLDQIEHALVREAMRVVGTRPGVEISTMADIPSEGSGLGSSAAVTVGLLHALYTFAGRLVTPETLAREACAIEIETLGKPIGKQDQYIAAYGGLREITFLPDDSVTVDSLPMGEEKRRRLGENLLLFYTGIARRSDTILTQQKQNIGAKRAQLDFLRAQTQPMRAALTANFDDVGALLDAGWQKKRGLAGSVSSDALDALYTRALSAGAGGGKIAGAGGGGFLLLFCAPENQSAVRAALSDLQELPFALERDGTKVIFNARR